MMDRFPRRLLAAAFLAVGLLSAATRAAAEMPVRLLAPAEGTVLVAGSTAGLDWAPLSGLERQAPWDEWEAFLSLDGGGTYPIRITPHLDRDLRRVTFRVPSFPTRQGRLLLRIGDERRETAFELPQRFTIAASAGTETLGNTFDLSRTVERRGEPARPGERGVLAWVEGDRRGGSVREVVAREPARAVPGLALPADLPAQNAVASAAPPSGAPAAEPGVDSLPPPPRAATAALPGPPRLTNADLLLLLKRRNE